MNLLKDCGLTPIEQCIAKMRCGIDCAPHTSEQIRAELSTTKERIHQIEADVLRKLRHGLETRESSAAQRNSFPPNGSGGQGGKENGNPSGTDGTT